MAACFALFKQQQAWQYKLLQTASQQQHSMLCRFAALQPVPESCDVVVLSGAAGAPACQAEHEAALQEEAGRLVAMALAAVRRSEDS